MNPPRLATAKAGADGSPTMANAGGSPGRGTAATTIPSDGDEENEPIKAAASTATQKPRKGGRARTDNQLLTNRKMASVTALAGPAPATLAVARASTPYGICLTMDDDDDNDIAFSPTWISLSCCMGFTVWSPPHHHKV